VPEPPLPPGYRHASVRWPEDVARRVDVHRAAFAPSKMTIEKYELLAARPHYSPQRDRVVVRDLVINTGRANRAAEALYESLGCVRVTTTRRYARPLPA